jgi:hypothetical protein
MNGGRCDINKQVQRIVKKKPPTQDRKKSKGVPLHAMEAHGGKGGIAPTHT